MKRPEILKPSWVPSSRTPQRMETRPRSMDEYHTARWTRESAAFRKDHPVCEECLRHGVIRRSEVVDHIVPAPVCEDFWDQSNWQALCRKCNIAKGNRDKKIINK